MRLNDFFESKKNEIEWSSLLVKIYWKNGVKVYLQMTYIFKINFANISPFMLLQLYWALSYFFSSICTNLVTLVALIYNRTESYEKYPFHTKNVPFFGV